MSVHFRIRRWPFFLGVAILVGTGLGLGATAGRAESKSEAAIQVAEEEQPAVPSKKALFGHQPVPYWGFGAVWIRPDGLILIETANNGGIAFFIGASPLVLADEQGQVRFKPPVSGQPIIHDFAAPKANAHSCSAVYRHVGDLSLDYDETTGRLEVRVEAGKETFVAAFEFRDSTAAVGAEAEQNLNAEQASCSCSCTGPAGGCSANKSCPEGSQCVCTCRCATSGTQCSCSACRPVSRLEVEVLHQD